MRRRLQYMGRMTAGMTHEINNVLAVIRETAGFAQDLISLSGPDSFPNREKALKCLEEVQRQIERGSGFTRALNRFAHSVDHERQTTPVQDIVALAVALNERHVRQKCAVLEAVETEASPALDADFFLVIEALSLLISRAVEDLGGEGKVLLSFDLKDTGRENSVRVWPEHAAPAGPANNSAPAAELASDLSAFGLCIAPPARESDIGWLLCW